MTAYGLLQFRDMARVYPVDATMIERTRNYLVSSKDGKGGFQRNARALDSFGRAPEDITNAYIVWALTESGKDDDVEKELAALLTQAKTSKDPYFLALVGNSLINRGKSDDGIPLLKTVAGAQKDDGHLEAARTSITGSGGARFTDRDHSSGCPCLAQGQPANGLQRQRAEGRQVDWPATRRLRRLRARPNPPSCRSRL